MIDLTNRPAFERGSLRYQKLGSEGVCLACHTVQEMPGEDAAIGVCNECGSAGLMSAELVLALADRLADGEVGEATPF